MDNKLDKLIITPGAKRIRLTREELLAGKCFPDDPPKQPEPGIKSSDWVIERSFPTKPPATHMDSEMRLSKLVSELTDLRERYHTEISQWKEYQARVEQWKLQVFAVVNRLKKELKEKE